MQRKFWRILLRLVWVSAAFVATILAACENAGASSANAKTASASAAAPESSNAGYQKPRLYRGIAEAYYELPLAD